MAELATQRHASFEEYLAAEQTSDVKHEWIEGVIYAMGATTLEHSRLAGNVHTALNNKLREHGCTVYPEGATVYVADTLGARPDVTLLCERPQTRSVLDKNGKVSAEALTNPVAIVEVLSDSTEAYDRGKKFGHYRRIASLREYVLVSQDDPLIEVFRPNAAGHWALEEEARTGQTVVIHGATIEVDSIYAA